MKEIVKNTQYVQESQDLLLYQFKNSPNINELVKIYGEQAQAVENEFFALMDALGIDSAVNYGLDLIGKEVGELRQSRNDTDYRSAILTRIYLNTSSGTPEDVRSATKQITGATAVKYSEQYPAEVVLEVLGAEYVSKAPIIRKVIPAGVDLVFKKQLDLEGDTMAYAGVAYSFVKQIEINPA